MIVSSKNRRDIMNELINERIIECEGIIYKLINRYKNYFYHDTL